MNLVGKKVELLKDVYPLKAGAKVEICKIDDCCDWALKFYVDNENGISYILRVDEAEQDSVFKVLV